MQASPYEETKVAQTNLEDIILPMGERKSLGESREHAHCRSTRKTLIELSLTTYRTFLAGIYRIELQLPGRIRLLRYQTRTFLRSCRQEAKQSRLSRVLRRSFPSTLFLLSLSCSILDSERTGPLENSPALSKKSLVKRRQMKAPWRYILPVDHGVRADKSGKGHFRASRFHGEHNGIDLLAPIGTPVFSACDGQIMSGASQSFGRWAHIVCPVPKDLAEPGGPQPWASFFFAHLKHTETPIFEWAQVKAGQVVGSVGKSGNAKGESVQPHVHFELIIQKNRRSALDERHLGSDQSDVSAAKFLTQSLKEKCLRPFGFRPKSRLLRRARRVDPFVALSCLSQNKPAYKKAKAPLDFASNAWSEFYIAQDFNINRGLSLP